MEEVLAALATSGAQTIVNLMATDLWGDFKDRITHIFTKKNKDEISSDLEVSRQRLLASSGSPSAVLKTEEDRWEARLRMCLVDNPDAPQLIRNLVEAAVDHGLTIAPTSVSISAQAYDNSRVYQLGQGVQHNN